jgi:long-chain acyl-CoA synthetase
MGFVLHWIWYGSALVSAARRHANSGAEYTHKGARTMLDFARLQALPDLLSYHAKVRPLATALEFEGRVTSYAELDERSTQLAALLRETSEEGARVAYLGKNSDRYFELLFAAAKAKCVLVPLNWRLAPDEWSYILRDAEAAALFVGEGFEEQGRALSALPGLRSIVPVETMTLPAAQARASSGVQACRQVRPDDVVVQIYTSGTTGKPKGAMLTHRNLLALREPGLRAALPWFPVAGDTSLVVMPVAHIAGTAYGLFGLYSGGRLVMGREFDGAAVWKLLAESRATHMLLAPTALRMLMQHPAGVHAALPDFRYLTYGGSPISPDFLEQCIARLGCGFVQMYGMTEAAGGVVVLTPDDHRTATPERLASAGRAMLGVELGVIDRNGSRLPAGQVGEIVVRSPSVMASYWKRPAATSETIVDGWLRTGDIGLLDEDGYLFVRDRAKDTIISGGENVYPLEVENMLLRHPDVADAAVIGVPSARWGEEVKALIVPKAGVAPDPAEVIAFMRQRLAAFKVPKSVEIVQDLPRNPNGKVLRRLLREPYWTGYDRRVD